MDCLDANAVQDLMSGALDSSARQGVLGHLDTCDDCRELLGVMARDTVKDQLKDTWPYPDALAATAAAAPVRDIALMETAAGDTGALAAAPAAQRLGHYTLVERIGAGAMGVVWRAEDPRLGRAVALKLLRRADAELVERLVREARSMAQVSHPNVVTVYEVGEAAGTAFIAMELVEGQSLRTWQTADRHTIPEIVEAYIAAGRGLAAAHARGIIHRDFKPDNVLVGKDGRVRVTDFGLAAAKPGERGAPSPIGDVNLTTSGSVLGTPAYMAPEQFAGGNVDPRTDQFNFCVALYEAVYGERPFAGATFEELGTNVCDGTLRAPPAGTEVSGALRAIVLRGLSVKPGDRYPTMDALLVELGRDRARTSRRIAFGAATLAVVLLIGLASDWSLRGRLTREIHQSFGHTGAMLDVTAKRLREHFRLVSDVVYREQALRQVSGHHDEADFGLRTPEQDRAELEQLRNTLASTEWVKFPGYLAIADYKGRLLYSSAAPQAAFNDLRALEPVKRALSLGEASVTVMPYSDPALASSGILGAAPHDGLAVIFERTLALGNTDAREARAIYLQIEDGHQLLDDLQLDRQTKLALVAPDGTATGDDVITRHLLAAAPRDGSINEARVGGDTYLVQARPVPGVEGQGTIATVIMARQLDGVLALFPGARTVFAAAALAAAALALAFAVRARRITQARI